MWRCLSRMNLAHCWSHDWSDSISVPAFSSIVRRNEICVNGRVAGCGENTFSCFQTLSCGEWFVHFKILSVAAKVFTQQQAVWPKQDDVNTRRWLFRSSTPIFTILYPLNFLPVFHKVLCCKIQHEDIKTSLYLAVSSAQPSSFSHKCSKLLLIT